MHRDCGQRLLAASSGALPRPTPAQIPVVSASASTAAPRDWVEFSIPTLNGLHARQKNCPAKASPGSGRVEHREWKTYLELCTSVKYFATVRTNGRASGGVATS